MLNQENIDVLSSAKTMPVNANKQNDSAKFNIVLVSLYNTESYSVRTLHAALAKAGFNVTTLFFKERGPNNTYNKCSPREIEFLAEQIIHFDPAMVGISVMSAFFELASEITKKIKMQSPALVLWGGIHPTIRPDQCLSVADAVCLGEGEKAIAELAEKASRGYKIDDIKNLWVKTEQGILKNDLNSLIPNLDSIPFPDYSVNNKYIIEDSGITPCDYDQVMSKFGMNFMTSRGCPFSCTYCVNGILRKIYKNKGSYVRQRSVDNVINELDYLKKNFNLAHIRFEDDVFACNFNFDWIDEFCEKYKKMINLPFSCYFHPKTTDERMVRLLKDAGLTHVSFGIQSGSEKIRHSYFKRFDTNQETIKTANIIAQSGISYSCDILMENPLEKNEDRRETLSLLLQLPKPFFVNTHTLTHFPEYELTNCLLANKLISEDDVEDVRKESFEHNRWNPYLDASRDPTNMLWSCLYHLASKKSFLSDKKIVQLSHSRILRRFPVFLLLLLKYWPALSSLKSWTGIKSFLYRVIKKCSQKIKC